MTIEIIRRQLTMRTSRNQLLAQGFVEFIAHASEGCFTKRDFQAKLRLGLIKFISEQRNSDGRKNVKGNECGRENVEFERRSARRLQLAWKTFVFRRIRGFVGVRSLENNFEVFVLCGIRMCWFVLVSVSIVILV